MATIFLDRKGVILMEFMQKGITMTSQVYCETLKSRSAINKGEEY
jgi:hypothetical protein